MEILSRLALTLKCLAASLALASLCASPAHAQELDRYYKVEAAFLYNFFNYITWPGYSSPQELQSATICIFENDPIQPYLEYVQRKMASERSLGIRTLRKGDTVLGCSLLFTRYRLPKEEKQILPKSTLVVIEPFDVLDRGEGMIELDREDQNIQMKINQQELVEKGYEVSSRLLALALK